MTDRELQALGQHVAEREDLLLAAVEPSEATRRHVAEYVAQHASRAGAAPSGRFYAFLRRPWLRLSLAAVLVLGLFLAKEALLWNPALTFSVGPSAQVGVLRAWESAPEDGRLSIRFSDGSLVDLEPNARARVVAVGRAGADIVLESGRAHLDVVPQRRHVLGESPWRISTGPFSVEVTGTRFDVSWEPRAGDFALDLFEGSVIVKGCGSDDGHRLLGGQGVRASCGRGHWSVVSLVEARTSPTLPSEPAPETPSGPILPQPDAMVPSQKPATPNGEELAASSPRTPARSRPALGRTKEQDERRSWQEFARAGHFAQAYDGALVLGFEAECARVSADDLALLGDAARLSGDAERARRAYLALRDRFAGETSAARAAFALGRLSIDTDPQTAARWFELYLREQPQGPLALAALDRLFELASSGDAEQQRAVAKTYLARHPSGPHANDARRILRPAPSAP